MQLVFWHSRAGASEQAVGTMASQLSATIAREVTRQAEYQGSYLQGLQKTMTSIQAGSPPEAVTAYHSMVADWQRVAAAVGLDDRARWGPLTYGGAGQASRLIRER